MGRVVHNQMKASEDFIGHTAADIDVIVVTPVCDTSAYASADLIFDPVEIVGAFRVPGGRIILDTVMILDKDDQGVALTLVFTNVPTTFGTLNSAPNISDTNLENVTGHVAFATTDYIDVGGAKVGTRGALGIVMEANSGATSLYVAGINGAGTPTFTAAGLKLKLGFRRS